MSNLYHIEDMDCLKCSILGECMINLPKQLKISIDTIETHLYHSIAVRHYSKASSIEYLI